MASFEKGIAIIGTACRLPGSVTNLKEFWQLLREERDAVTEIPAERFGTDFYQHPAKSEPGKSYTFAAGVLDDPMQFDAEFFDISPRMADYMDPQQRLLLELAWEAFEDAGVLPANMRGQRCGVYIGVEMPEYFTKGVDDVALIGPYSSTGGAISIIANRVSYMFDLRGPSMSINTACSSALVAMHQAVRALQDGEVEYALAGGINMLMHPACFIGFAKASMLSPRGRCHAFDASGDGFVRAEGAGLFLLKRLDQALADGDTIHAVIAGSGVNSDGYTPGGIVVPDSAAQATLLREVYGRAGVDVRTLAYLEAHGTGTAVGDPIETHAIGLVAAAGRAEDDPLLIGSAKTNVGHLETAAAVPGLLKALLCIKHRAVPRTLHFETPNPAIDFKALRLRVVDRYTPIEARGDKGIVIGVNSFGFGGTNAHVIVMEPPAAAAVSASTPAHARQKQPQPAAPLPPLVLTARAPQALSALAQRYLALLDDGHDWAALVAQVARRRQWLKQRAVIAPADLDEGRRALAALAQNEAVPDCVVRGQAREDGWARTALVYSGNGSQWAGMGRQLYAEHALFRAALDEVDAFWCADGSASLVEVMKAGASAEWLAATENAQPLLFALQVGITRVLQARGLTFEATLGHSVGEIAAAWADGALTLEQAVHVIKARSHAQAPTRGSGRMAAAGLSEEDARQLIDRLGLSNQVEVAGINSPQSVTLAGMLEGLQKVETAVREIGQFFQILDLEYAFHSTHMDSIKPVVLEQLADLKPGNGRGGYISTVTGDRLEGSQLDATYWWLNIREPVRFGAAVTRLADEGVQVFLEVGPHAILRTYVKQTLDATGKPGVALGTLKRGEDGAAALDQTLWSAVAQGAAVDLDVFAPASPDAPRVALPTYPWQRKRYWLNPTPESYNLAARRREHPLLGYRIHDAAWVWENQLDPVKMPMLADHQVDGGMAFPGAGYVEMALAAGRQFFGTESVALENLEIQAPVVFQAQQSKVFRFTLQADTARFVIESRDRLSDAEWTKNVSGRLLPSGSVLGANGIAAPAILQAVLEQPARNTDPLYQDATRRGCFYGPAFRAGRQLRIISNRAALIDLAVPEEAGGAAALATYLLHPVLIDGGFHALLEVMGHIYVPVHFGRIDYLRGATVCQSLMLIERSSPHSVVASFYFMDATNTVVARLSATRFRLIDFSVRYGNAPPSRFRYMLEARPLPGDFRADAAPAPATLIAQATDELARSEDAATRKRHLTEILPLLDVLASLYALAAFDELNLYAQPAPVGHETLVARLADMLVEDGLARREGDRLVRDDQACAKLPASADLWRDLLADASNHVAELTLLAHCGMALPRLLAGKLEADKVLSSTGRSLLEQYFEASPTWSHARQLMGACAEQAVNAWSNPRRLRVLEIGASDSEVLHPLDMQLPEGRCERVLAGTPGQLAGWDAQTLSGARAQTWPPVQNAPTDASEDTAPYDLALVRCALAIKTDPLETLRKVYDALAPGALVVVVQPSRGRFTDIVLGLSAGGGADGALALLAPAHLAALLEQAGFTEVVRHAEDDLNLAGVPSFAVARKPVEAPSAPQQTPAATPHSRAPASALAASDALASAQAAKPSPRHWIVLHNTPADAQVCAELSATLIAADDISVSVPLHEAQAQVEALALPDGQVCEMVFVAPLADGNDGAALMQAQQAGVIALGRLARTFGATAREHGRLRLSVVTRGGAPFAGETPLTAGEAPLHPEQASLWGLGRVIANEYPGWPVRLIDAHPGHDAGAARATWEALVRELRTGDGEEEVLLTTRGRWVTRMAGADIAARRGADTAAPVLPAKLFFNSPGSLRNLEWFALPERALEADEVEIQPAASGLNFRDVMYAMGLLSDEAVENGFAGASVGMEFSGRVLRVGAEVKNFAPGDAVLGFASASFAARVHTRAAALSHKPDVLSFEEAATIPTTFFTAWYALVEMARLRRGERVLVHGGAGGVGIAAIQIARYFGAEVFATAGSNEKREFVALLGADRVLDSRSLDFADEIRVMTNGEGVDIVLNSLAGEAMVRSIDTLRPFGRFLELGKRDFYENSQIGLRPFRNNISYFGIDADQLMGVHPELTARLFAELMQLFEQRVLYPLPYRAFPAAQVEAAFRYMQQSRQIGKVLVTYPHGTPMPTRNLPAPALPSFGADGAYLIVGGTGGFGFATARWMVARGARHVTLLSRSGKLDEAQSEEIARWQAKGARVEAVACDATDADALAKLVETIEARGTPVKGAVHSAMQIDDGLLQNMDDERFAKVLAPKVAGAWNLHRVLQGRALDCFVLYSSITTYLGSPGQGNYVAANSFLEALVAQRRAAGQPALFMAWGPIEDVGFMARNAKTHSDVQERLGASSITSGEALAALDAALTGNLAAGEAVVRLDWHIIGRGLPAAHARRYALMSGTEAEAENADGGQLRERVASLPAAKAQEVAAEALRAQIARILHTSPESIELEKPMTEMGIDSLMSMELGMAVENTFQVKLSMMSITGGATVMTLAAHIVNSIQGSEGGGTAAADQAAAELAGKHGLATKELTALESAIASNTA